MAAAARVLRSIAVYREAETLINIGAYAKGANPEIDEAIRMAPAVEKSLRQAIEERATLKDSVDELKKLRAAPEEAPPEKDDSYQRSGLSGILILIGLPQSAHRAHRPLRRA